MVPPATGIIHQVNIEYLSEVISENDGLLYPDSVFGTDSHTSDRVGQYVNDVKENLIKIGFEDVSTFTGRLKD